MTVKPVEAYGSGILPAVDLPDQGGGAAHVSETAFSLVRRVDWRFLLPCPQLRSVVYLGEGEGSLAEALRLFSDSLVTLAPSRELPSTRSRHPSPDLLVAQGSDPAGVEAACRLLSPKGFLYWEIRRTPWSFLRRFHRVARSLGFGDARLHWHHPDFESCRHIVPLDDLPAVSFFLEEHKVGLWRSLGAAAGRGLAAMNLLAGFLPCVSVVASRGQGAE